MQLKYILFGLFFSTCLSLFSTEWPVTIPNDASFRKVCVLAKNSDTITFDQSLDGKIITLTSSIADELNNKDVIIRIIKGSVTISSDPAQGTFNLFLLEQAKNITFENINFSKGGTDPQMSTMEGGGAILFKGENLTLINCDFNDNVITQGNGGAINFDGKSLNLTNCNFEDNNVISNGDGGAVDFDGLSLEVKNCKFSNNRIATNSESTGGAINFDGDSYPESTLKIDSTDFEKNQITSSSESGGGNAAGVSFKGDHISITNSSFIQNTFNTYEYSLGGALALNVYKDLVIKHNLFEGNGSTSISGSDGGAIFTLLNENVTSAEISYSTFKENQTYNNGEALYVINNSTISLNLLNSTFSGDPANSTSYSQSGIYLEDGKTNFQHNTICDFTSSNQGAAVKLSRNKNNTTTTFSNNLFSNNKYNNEHHNVLRVNQTYIVTEGGNMIDIEKTDFNHFPYFNTDLDYIGNINSPISINLAGFSFNNNTLVPTRNLKNNSPARDVANKSKALKDDANFKTRDATPDIGAAEYGSALGPISGGSPAPPSTDCNLNQITLVGNIPTSGSYSGKWVIPNNFNGYITNTSGNTVIIEMYGDEELSVIWQIENDNQQFHNYKQVINYEHFPLKATNNFWKFNQTSCEKSGYKDLAIESNFSNYSWKSYTVDDDLSNGQDPTTSSLIDDYGYLEFEYNNLKSGLNKIVLEFSKGSCKSIDTLVISYEEANIHPDYLPTGRIITKASSIELPYENVDWQYDQKNSASGGTTPSYGSEQTEGTAFEVYDMTPCRRYRFTLKNNPEDNCPAYYVDIIKEPSIDEKCLTIVQHGYAYNYSCSGNLGKKEIVSSYSAPYTWSSTNDEVIFSNSKGLVSEINTGASFGEVAIKITASGNAFDTILTVYQRPILDLGKDIITQEDSIGIIVLDTFPTDELINTNSQFTLNNVNLYSETISIDDRNVGFNLIPKENILVREYQLSFNEDGRSITCEGYDTLIVFYETETDSNEYVQTIELSIETEAELIFNAFELLKKEFPGLDEDQLSVADIDSDNIKGKNVTVKAFNQSRGLFRLKYDNIDDILPEDFVLIKICMNDKNACYNLRVNLSTIIESDEYIKPVVFNAISPNGDGKNDVFYIEYNEGQKDISVQIFSRQGNVVWETKNYDNEENNWNGTDQNGDPLIEGTYFFIIQFTKIDTDNSESNETIKGYVVLKK